MGESTPSPSKEPSLLSFSSIKYGNTEGTKRGRMEPGPEVGQRGVNGSERLDSTTVESTCVMSSYLPLKRLDALRREEKSKEET